MRTLIAVTSLAMALDTRPGAESRQARRRRPARRCGPSRSPRSFDQRWFGPAQADRWISNQPPPSDRFTPQATQQPAEAQNRAHGAPRPRRRATAAGPSKARPLVTAAAGDICTRHNLRKVWQGRTWRCR